MSVLGRFLPIGQVAKADHHQRSFDVPDPRVRPTLFQLHHMATHNSSVTTDLDTPKSKFGHPGPNFSKSLDP